MLRFEIAVLLLSGMQWRHFVIVFLSIVGECCHRYRAKSENILSRIKAVRTRWSVDNRTPEPHALNVLLTNERKFGRVDCFVKLTLNRTCILQRILPKASVSQDDFGLIYFRVKGTTLYCEVNSFHPAGRYACRMVTCSDSSICIWKRKLSNSHGKRL